MKKTIVSLLLAVSAFGMFACDAYKAELTAKLSSVIDLQADFTAEYTAAMEKMNG